MAKKQPTAKKLVAMVRRAGDSLSRASGTILEVRTRREGADGTLHNEADEELAGLFDAVEEAQRHVDRFLFAVGGLEGDGKGKKKKAKGSKKKSKDKKAKGAKKKAEA
jgi:hypothetical protein